MKRVSIFLVALTVFTTLFLKSFTAAVDSTTSEDTMEVDESVKQRLDEAMKCSQKHKTSAINILDGALPTAGGDVKETLSGAANFTKSLLAICIRLNKEMNDAFANCSTKGLKKVLAELIEAINKANVEWSELKNKLVIVPINVRAAYIEEMEKNFEIDDGIKEKLKEIVGWCR